METFTQNNSLLNIEKAILNIALSDNENYLDIVDKLSVEHFNDRKHKAIYQAILFISDTNSPNVHLVSLFLSENKLLTNSNIEEYILELLSFQNADIKNLDEYIKKLITFHNHSKLKNTIKTWNAKIANSNPSDLEEIKQKLENEINGLDSSKNDETTYCDVIVKETISKIDLIQSGQIPPGLKTGFTYFDMITSGLQSGDLIIIAARPSMGKTALALNIANNVAKNKETLLFSLEMPKDQLIQRMLSLNTKISSQKFKKVNGLNNQEKLLLFHGKDVVSSLKLAINDNAGLNINQLRLIAKKHNNKAKVSLIIIDYLQLLSGSKKNSENRQQEVSNISRSLKALAREIGAPIIALSQLSRSVEKRENKRPMMSDLRESGAIEQDADLILFLHRESYYEHESNNNPSEITNIIVAKNRNGSIGNFDLSFNKNSNSFTNLRKKE